MRATTTDDLHQRISALDTHRLPCEELTHLWRQVEAAKDRMLARQMIVTSVRTHYSQLRALRDVYFQEIESWSLGVAVGGNAEDPQLDAIIGLTRGGRDIQPFEFALMRMVCRRASASAASSSSQWFSFASQLVKFNFSIFPTEQIETLLNRVFEKYEHVESDDALIESMLSVLDALVKFGSVPPTKRRDVVRMCSWFVAQDHHETPLGILKNCLATSFGVYFMQELLEMAASESVRVSTGALTFLLDHQYFPTVSSSAQQQQQQSASSSMIQFLETLAKVVKRHESSLNDLIFDRMHMWLRHAGVAAQLSPLDWDLVMRVVAEGAITDRPSQSLSLVIIRIAEIYQFGEYQGQPRELFMTGGKVRASLPSSTTKFLIHEFAGDDALSPMDEHVVDHMVEFARLFIHGETRLDLLLEAIKCFRGVIADVMLLRADGVFGHLDALCSWISLQTDLTTIEETIQLLELLLQEHTKRDYLDKVMHMVNMLIEYQGKVACVRLSMLLVASLRMASSFDFPAVCSVIFMMVKYFDALVEKYEESYDIGIATLTSALCGIRCSPSGYLIVESRITSITVDEHFALPVIRLLSQYEHLDNTLSLSAVASVNGCLQQALADPMLAADERALPLVTSLRNYLVAAIVSNKRSNRLLKASERAQLLIADYRLMLVIAAMFRRMWSKKEQDEFVSAFQVGLTYPAAVKTCIHAFRVLGLEIPVSFKKLLPALLARLIQVMTSTWTSVHLLEYLHALGHSDLFSHFTEQEYKQVFAIAVRYIQHHQRLLDEAKLGASESLANIAFGQYVLHMAYQVIGTWFVRAVNPLDRPRYAPFIQRGLASSPSSTDLMALPQASSDDKVQVCLDLLAWHIMDDKQLVAGGAVPSNASVRCWISGNTVIGVYQEQQQQQEYLVVRTSCGIKRKLVERGDRSPDVVWSELMGARAPPEPAFIEIPMGDERFTRSLAILDRTPNTDLHKISVLYVGYGQRDEASILGNTGGSLAYHRFLECLGQRTPLKHATIFTGGLDTEMDLDGQEALYWRDELRQIIYHVATMMPTRIDADPKCLGKKRHVGNDFVAVVWNESGRPASEYAFDTIPGQFNFVNIMVTPIKGRRDVDGDGIGDAYEVVMQKHADMPEFGPVIDGKVVSSISNAAELVRFVAIHANLFAHIYLHVSKISGAASSSPVSPGGSASKYHDEYATNRLYQIRTLKQRVQQYYQQQQLQQ